jgi:hypothetical protein
VASGDSGSSEVSDIQGQQKRSGQKAQYKKSCVTKEESDTDKAGVADEGSD